MYLNHTFNILPSIAQLMCYHTKQSKDIKPLEERFEATVSYNNLQAATVTTVLQIPQHL